MRSIKGETGALSSTYTEQWNVSGIFRLSASEMHEYVAGNGRRVYLIRAAPIVGALSVI
jgi:hypothetical protein